MIRPTERRKGFTLVELLVVIAIISIIAGLVMPGIMRGIDESLKLECTKNLRSIHTAAFLYAKRGRVFPFANVPRPRAHESLNELLESRFATDLGPDFFICPASDALPAEVEESDDGRPRFVLDGTTNSYAWVAKRTKFTRRGFLAADKYYEGYEDDEGIHSGHPDVVMALETSGNVLELPADATLLATGKLPPGLVR